MDDPFFPIKDDIEASLNTASVYCERYLALCQQAERTSENLAHDDSLGLGSSATVTHQEKEWISTELRNILRSIEWDLEDFELTGSLVSENSSATAGKRLKSYRYYPLENRSAFDSADSVCIRKFADSTRQAIQEIRERMSGLDSRFKISSPLTSSYRGGQAGGSGNDSSQSRNLNQYKYSKLDDFNSDVRYSEESTIDPFVDNIMAQQKSIIKSQDENLEKIGGSVHVLKDMSQKISTELTEQSIMLDDLTHETERTHSRLDVVMKKLAKVTHMSDDRRQWQVIGILVAVLLIVILLFIIM